ncbi:uncharacterized protein L201_003952 [Kwoniella dendrophila CBS 6074]|uniref:Secreted protein n=1 Tax=Kwoniella dendrophila CBS 6074 TaxID=1295534 RepID=A0AAX4JW62_9TREE
MISKFFISFLVLALCLTLVQSKPLALNTKRSSTSISIDKKSNSDQDKIAKRSSKLSNAERIARGLPLNQPKRLYDGSATHAPQAKRSGIP